MLDIGISYFLQISYKKVRNLSSHPDNKINLCFVWGFFCFVILPLKVGSSQPEKFRFLNLTFFYDICTIL